MADRESGRIAATSSHGTRDAGRPFDAWSDPRDIDRAQWNELLAASGEPTVFLRHEWLCALHESGSATARTGWHPRFLTTGRDGRLDGAMALYRKDHSWGEYVFDWAWANAYEQHGLPYYPKLVGAVPFTPVPGSRLLTRSDPVVGRQLLDAAVKLARDEQCSSVHLLFPSQDDLESAQAAGWQVRQGVQFHWHNRQPAAYKDFDEFLGTLHRDKRKKILQERRQVREAGIEFDVLEGTEIQPEDWAFFHRCYVRTYLEHRSTPYLNLRCFELAGRDLADHWVLFVARRGAQRVGASLLAVDPDRRVAYGRYWGSLEAVRCLHFEACYYQPLAWCIAQGYARFEGGAQGEHKIARGLMPVPTWSAHWLADHRFARAIEQFLARERIGASEYMEELHERSPFKPGSDSAPPPMPD